MVLAGDDDVFYARGLGGEDPGGRVVLRRVELGDDLVVFAVGDVELSLDPLADFRVPPAVVHPAGTQ